MPIRDGYEIFGYWDCFNECLYKLKSDADKAAAGGNVIIPLYRRV